MMNHPQHPSYDMPSSQHQHQQTTFAPPPPPNVSPAVAATAASASSSPPYHAWQHMTRTVAHYKRLEQIGEGTYGQVYRAICQDTGQPVALKKMRLLSGRGYWGMPLQLIREIKILKQLHHPNLLQMIEVVTSKGVEHLDPDDPITTGDPKKRKDKSGENQHEEDQAALSREKYKGNLFLVLEYVTHDLTGLMDVAYQFTEVQTKCIFRQLLEALSYMHSQRYCHRDIKSSNILLDSHYRLRLADFGLARRLEPPLLDQMENHSSSGTMQDLTNKVITLWYRPPEILLGSVHYNCAVDVWSAGCILVELFTGKPLAAGKTELEQLSLLADLTGTPDEDTWKYLISLKKTRTLHDAILPTAESWRDGERFPSKLREKYGPNSSSSKRHHQKFPETAITLLEKLLVWDPRKRLTAANALQHKYFWTQPVAPANPAELGQIQVASDGHFHEFQTKQKRRQAKQQAEEARDRAVMKGMGSEEANEYYDKVYRGIMKQVAEEGLTADTDQPRKKPSSSRPSNKSSKDDGDDENDDACGGSDGRNRRDMRESSRSEDRRSRERHHHHHSSKRHRSRERASPPDDSSYADHHGRKRSRRGEDDDRSSTGTTHERRRSNERRRAEQEDRSKSRRSEKERRSRRKEDDDADTSRELSSSRRGSPHQRDEEGFSVGGDRGRGSSRDHRHNQKRNKKEKRRHRRNREKGGEKEKDRENLVRRHSNDRGGGVAGAGGSSAGKNRECDERRRDRDRSLDRGLAAPSEVASRRRDEFASDNYAPAGPYGPSSSVGPRDRDDPFSRRDDRMGPADQYGPPPPSRRGGMGGDGGMGPDDHYVSSRREMEGPGDHYGPPRGGGRDGDGPPGDHFGLPRGSRGRDTEALPPSGDHYGPPSGDRYGRPGEFRGGGPSQPPRNRDGRGPPPGFRDGPPPSRFRDVADSLRPRDRDRR